MSQAEVNDATVVLAKKLSEALILLQKQFDHLKLQIHERDVKQAEINSRLEFMAKHQRWIPSE